MKLDSITKLAEIVASVAVIVSLVILTHEIQENTETAKRTTYENLSTKIIDWRMARVVDADFFKLYYEETSQHEWSLEGEDRERFIAYIESLWQVYEQAHYAYRSGDLGRDEWERFERWICSDTTPEHAWERVKNIMSEPFVEFVDNCRAR